MKSPGIEKTSVAQLVEKFTALCLAQYLAELRNETGAEHRLIKQMWAVRDELMRRPGDQRTELLALYSHPNVQVRLMAAKETLAVAPAAARHMLQTIRESKEYPQAMDAGMTLRRLDSGDFRPE